MSTPSGGPRTCGIDSVQSSIAEQIDRPACVGDNATLAPSTLPAQTPAEYRQRLADLLHDQAGRRVLVPVDVGSDSDPAAVIAWAGDFREAFALAYAYAELLGLHRGLPRIVIRRHRPLSPAGAAALVERLRYRPSYLHVITVTVERTGQCGVALRVSNSAAERLRPDGSAW